MEPEGHPSAGSTEKEAGVNMSGAALTPLAGLCARDRGPCDPGLAVNPDRKGLSGNLSVISAPGADRVGGALLTFLLTCQAALGKLDVTEPQFPSP